MASFDKWTLVKLIEIFLVVSCLVCKRVTDDEARSLFLYLQKISREWSLLNNVTWDRVGAAVAHATFGGYFIITVALFVGKCVGEIPTEKRITERILLIVGAILFIVLGSLAFAALDSVPPDLVDNAAVLGTLALVTGMVFLVDAAGPGRRKRVESSRTYQSFSNSRAASQQNLENGIEATTERNGKVENGREKQNGIAKSKVPTSTAEQSIPAALRDLNLDVAPTTKALRSEAQEQVYREMEDDFRRRFGIYGKDALETDKGEPEILPTTLKIEQHSPVWGQTRKGLRGNINIITLEAPQRVLSRVQRPPEAPGSPLDPGYVQYTAQRWGDPVNSETKTPRHSPTDV